MIYERKKEIRMARLPWVFIMMILSVTAAVVIAPLALLTWPISYLTSKNTFVK